MKKPIIVSVIMALMLLTWGSFAMAQPQGPALEEKPTFYRLVPGTYLNGWPRFTVTYPKDWIERPLPPGGLFYAAPSKSAQMEGVGVFALARPLPLDKYVDFLMQSLKSRATDVTLVSDKPTQLRDGTPARELEFKFKMLVTGELRNVLIVAIKKGDCLISVNLTTHKEPIGEDLRAIPYSIELEPGKDEPVKVPSDIQEFLDKWCSAQVAHDLAKFMATFSDKYLNSGIRKGEVERVVRQVIGSFISAKETITEFVPASDRAYITGFVVTNFGTVPIGQTAIIKESGEWKWYGNQRDVSP